MHIIVFFPRPCGDIEKYVSKGLRMVEYFSHFSASTTRQELAIVVRKKVSVELLL